MKSIHRYGLGAVGIAAVALTLSTPIASADIVGQDGSVSAITADCGPTPTPTPPTKPGSPSGTGSSTSALTPLLGALLGAAGTGSATSGGTGASIG
ncbi:hypothetical protein D7D52_02450 [Nocardia yunnanensis]|uniref:Uncharacterized protein n=1 Tax=Nocardia yunnanensis TaxID=2382165 RepID=A0A386Z6N9_9NOCA|nr:hypothetical protein [Nocardia yunnanensis]AYF72913.1 hypothetical protein D7D52_02450 [Nocardia yunnanensis]